MPLIQPPFHLGTRDEEDGRRDNYDRPFSIAGFSFDPVDRKTVPMRLLQLALRPSGLHV